MSEICFMPAHELCRMVHSKEVSCEELVGLHYDQIERVNPLVNAIVTLVPRERALRQAASIDRALAQGTDPGPLAGIPVVHKDLVPTKGIRTTFGSPIYRNHVPEVDGLIVERLKAAGAVTLGKTNTPEFGAGCQTFNPVFGSTRNPWDLEKTCGGSSGGAAVAVACGMVPLADGSDTGGSLRNPANFCGVVGFRTSPGRVPFWPRSMAWFPLAVQGPIARTVDDTALMLSVIAGPDARSPISIMEPGELFARPLHRDFKGVKAAWCPDLGGLPLDRRIRTALEQGKEALAHTGCSLEEACPDLKGAQEVFRILRAWNMELRFGSLLERHRDLIKDTVIWDIELGRKITGPDIGRAEVLRTEIYHRVRSFMEQYEFLLCAVNQVPPFHIEMPYVEEIEGVPMGTYYEWMSTCYFISILGLPAISVPFGFTEDGLPVGLQIVGRHNDDLGVLQLAKAVEEATGLSERRPHVVKS